MASWVDGLLGGMVGAGETVAKQARDGLEELKKEAEALRLDNLSRLQAERNQVIDQENLLVQSDLSEERAVKEHGRDVELKKLDQTATDARDQVKADRELGEFGQTPHQVGGKMMIFDKKGGSKVVGDAPPKYEKDARPLTFNEAVRTYTDLVRTQGTLEKAFAESGADAAPEELASVREQVKLYGDYLQKTYPEQIGKAAAPGKPSATAPRLGDAMEAPAGLLGGDAPKPSSPKVTPKDAAPTIVKTGTDKKTGRKVNLYSDGTKRYAD